MCDVEGVITSANAPAGRLAGKHADALVGAHVEQLVSAPEYPSLRELVDRLLVGELMYADAAHTVAVDDGSERRIALHYGVVRNAAAEALALVVVAHELAEPEIYETAEAVAS